MSEQRTGRAIDLATQHYDEMSKPGKRRKMVVREWGNTEIYVNPLTQDDISAVIEWADGKNAWLFPAYICFCAMDKEGNKLYNLGDVGVMAGRTDGDVVARVAAWISSDRNVTQSRVEEAEKNS